MKSLVAYFSCSGTTEKVAKLIADTLHADLYEIQPKEPYTSADLNWMDSSSRSSVEMSNKSSRPAIGNKVENMEAYDVVYLGFPKMEYSL
ncbi:flavodoxin [Amedibacterium intestinale]|uniref:flavodoxin n=1 Tax=Amedibacterium intestinale TaxID=2583452 RepID=UPI000E548297|nr:flavodoxin [Amedibacterium intestinale]RHO33992.1 flavodoxin [Erysipelotrichaceae bacterium AM17-60]